MIDWERAERLELCALGHERNAELYTGKRHEIKMNRAKELWDLIWRIIT